MKSISFKKILEKSVHPKIHKHCRDDSIDFNGLVFVWTNFPSIFLKETDYNNWFKSAVCLELPQYYLEGNQFQTKVEIS